MPLRRALVSASPAAVLCFALLPACGEDAPAPDAGPPDAAAPDADTHGGLLLPRCEDTEPLGSADFPQVASTLVSTLVPNAPRLAMPGDLNPATEDGEALYRTMGFDVLAIGPAQERVHQVNARMAEIKLEKARTNQQAEIKKIFALDR